MQLSLSHAILSTVLYIIVLVVVSCLLWIIWAREQVKKDLCGKMLRPISIRWHPYAYWAPLWHRTTSFDVTFEDYTGSAGKGRCIVRLNYRWRTRVWWVSNDVAYMRKLPLLGRIVYAAVAVFFIQFAVRSLAKGESIYRFGRKWPWSHPPIPIRGRPAILLSLAAFCGAWYLLTHVAFYYEKKNRARFYEASSRASSILGWALFLMSLLVYFHQQFKVIFPAE
jgi:hypothetical protein